MALIKCKECGENVSSKAKACPNCGAKPPAQTSLFTWLVLFTILYLVLSPMLSDVGQLGMTPEERAAYQAQRETERQAERERKAQQEIKEKRKGFHCLSDWDGSHDGVVRFVKARLRDPDSFEHIETRISAVDENGQHTLIMQYRAANGFGGINLESALATIDNADCRGSVTVTE